MRTLKESILDKDFDIDDSDPVAYALSPIYRKNWSKIRGLISFKDTKVWKELIDIIKDLHEYTKKNHVKQKANVYIERGSSRNAVTTMYIVKPGGEFLCDMIAVFTNKLDGTQLFFTRLQEPKQDCQYVIPAEVIDNMVNTFGIRSGRF